MLRWAGRWRNHVTRLALAGCDLLFPPQCANCGKEIHDSGIALPFCDECLSHLGPMEWRGCRRCGSECIEEGPTPDACGLCRKAKLQFDAVIPLGGYRAGLRDAVLRMKRPTHNATALAVGRLLIERRREQLADINADLIVPIPMFWRRRFHRGQNSPDVVAGCLANALDVPLGHRVLGRCRNTLPQASLAPTRRFENVQGAFCVRRPAKVQDARILLVDDILTTGATCSEAAKTLKQAGAASVAVAIIARAQGRE